MRRVLVVIFIIIVVAAALLAAYVLRYPCERQPFPPVVDPILRYRCAIPGPTPMPGPGGLPTAGPPPAGGVGQAGQGGLPGGAPPPFSASQRFGVLSHNPVSAFFVDRDTVVAVGPDGKIIRIRNGGVESLYEATIEGFISAAFSSDGKKVAVVSGSPGNPSVGIFDVVTGTWQSLPQGSGSPSWAPADNRLAYLAGVGPKELTTIDTAKPTAKPQLLIKLRAEDLKLDWVGPNEMFLAEKPSALTLGSIWNFKIKERTFSLLLQDREGLEVLWDGKSGRGLAFASKNRRGGELEIVDGRGATVNRLNFLTLPSKCTFGPKEVGTATSTGSVSLGGATSTPRFLICAVPRDQEKLKTSTLPDLYYERALFTADDFYKIDLRDGTTKAVFADSNQNLDAEKLVPSDGKLFFVNRLDQKLYAFTLE